MAASDWHFFDIERGYDVRQLDDNTYEIRDADGKITELSAYEFEQLRAEGVNPKGL
jgi:hypothetical protein